MKKALLIGLGYLALNCSLISSIHAECTPPPSGLAGWFRAEGTANDDVTSGNISTLVNNAGFSSGEVGTAFNFDGINQYLLVQQTNSSLNIGLGDGFTIEAWINPSTLSQRLPIVEYEKNLGTYDGSDVGIQFYGCQPPGSGNFYVNIIDTNGESHFLTSEDNTITNDSWQHVALTYDKISGTATIYCNNHMVIQTNLGNFTPQTSFQNVLVGARTTFGSAVYPADVFAGKIDELAFYNRALSSNEIGAIYLTSDAGKCHDSLPPFIVTQPESQTVFESDAVTLAVTVASDGPFLYQWRFNGTNIASATNSTLTLNNLHSWQSGNYSAKVTTPYGNVTSSNALVTVLGRTKLVYNYSGNEKTTGGSNEVSYAFSGQMIYFPDATNGVFIGWATIANKKQYWVSYFADYQLIQFIGKSKQVYTVLGKVGGASAENGIPNLWSYFHKGANTSLLIGIKKNFDFPSAFSAKDFLIYPDQQIANMILRESTSTYNFAAQATQTANNNGQTLNDLIALQIKALEKQGYKQITN